MASTLTKNDMAYKVNVKGALDNLLTKCKYIIKNGKEEELTEEYKKEILDKANEMSNKALRVLACAYKIVDKQINSEDFEKDLVLVGIVGMIDPPREEVKASINEAKKAGITVIMITGDHKNTAFAIAKQLGIAKKKLKNVVWDKN